MIVIDENFSEITRMNDRGGSLLTNFG